MSHQLIQINFKYSIPGSEFEREAAHVASSFAGFPGLVWKIWLQNENRSEAGGIYLFENAESAKGYLNSELFKRLETNPLFSHVSVKIFDTLEEPGLITRAPMYAPAFY